MALISPELSSDVWTNYGPCYDGGKYLELMCHSTDTHQLTHQSTQLHTQAYTNTYNTMEQSRSDFLLILIFKK